MILKIVVVMFLECKMDLASSVMDCSVMKLSKGELYSNYCICMYIHLYMCYHDVSDFQRLVYLILIYILTIKLITEFLYQL